MRKILVSFSGAAYNATTKLIVRMTLSSERMQFTFTMTGG